MARHSTYLPGRLLQLLLVISVGCATQLSAQQFGDFTYFVHGGSSVEIRSYPADAVGSVEIPDEIEGLPVTRIGRNAFKDIVGITSVTFPESLTSIDFGSFEGCTGLTAIDLPQNLTTIYGSAFSGCNGLASISFPDSVRSIFGSAFRNCSSLASITLPPDLTSVSEFLFTGCRELREINLPPGLLTISRYAFSGCLELTELDIPDGVSTIASRAFSGCLSLERVKLPASLTTIESRAFSGCTKLGKLREVTFPAGLLSVGSNAFYGCSSLERITFLPGLVSIDGNAFAECSGLSVVTFPEGLISIAGNAFRGAELLICLNLPSTLETLESYAFRDCTSLPSVVIPAGLTNLETNVFRGCSSLGSFSVDPINPSYVSVDGVLFSTDLKTLVQFPPGRGGFYSIPAGAEEIGGSAFSSSGVTLVVLPESLTTLGSAPFTQCRSLEGILVAAGNSSFTSVDGVLFNAEQTELLQYPLGREGRYEIPDGVVSIGAWAFSSSRGLDGEELIIPASITEIGYQAFNLGLVGTTVFFAGDAPSIGSYAFDSFAGGPALFYLSDRTGFSILQSRDYFGMEIDVEEHPAASWMLENGYSPFSTLNGDVSGDGIPLLYAYALNLDPRQHLTRALPRTYFGPDSLNLTFHSGAPGISYQAETSVDLENWTTEGVMLNGPDPANRQTATVPRNDPERFLRLSIVNDGSGPVALRDGPLVASLDSLAPGSTRSNGDGGPNDNLPWQVGGGATVQEEANYPNPPPNSTSILYANQQESSSMTTAIHFYSRNIDLQGVPNEDVIASIDLRTYDGSSGSNFEESDTIEAWLEGSADGVNFSRFDGSTIIPYLAGNLDLGMEPAGSPNADDLKKLELPNGQYTTFSTDGNSPIPPEIRFIRVRIVAAHSSRTEYYFLDNISVRLAGQ